uniref:WRKY transcription factor n=1 Tax=Rhizophora mucronata TaxID=61149 RepID=A0A2P2P9K0_RHIMU
MFTVTYTGEHSHPAPTHRNSLAGSTRQKTVPPQTVTASDSNNPSPSKPVCSSPATSLVEDELQPQSTNTESREDVDLLEDEEEDELCGFLEMAASNDFFAGLEEELAGSVAGDRFSDHFAPSFGHPWLANNAATAAGGF